jgi:toxin YoeB
VRITFTSHGWDDYASWADDRKVLPRINRLIEEAAVDPGVGTAKPERLSGSLSGFGPVASTRNTGSCTRSRVRTW